MFCSWSNVISVFHTRLDLTRQTTHSRWPWHKGESIFDQKRSDSGDTTSVIRGWSSDTTSVMETAHSNIDCLLVLPPASLKRRVYQLQVKPAQTLKSKHYCEQLPGGITAVARVFRKVDTRAGQQGIVLGKRRINYCKIRWKQRKIYWGVGVGIWNLPRCDLIRRALVGGEYRQREGKRRETPESRRGKRECKHFQSIFFWGWGVGSQQWIVKRIFVILMNQNN